MYRNTLNTNTDKPCIVKGKDYLKNNFIFPMKSSQIKILPDLADLVDRLRISLKGPVMDFSQQKRNLLHNNRASH